MGLARTGAGGWDLPFRCALSGRGISSLSTPIDPGHEVAGVVEAVGEGVKRLRKGDRVVLITTSPVGLLLL